MICNEVCADKAASAGCCIRPRRDLANACVSYYEMILYFRWVNVQCAVKVSDEMLLNAKVKASTQSNGSASISLIHQVFIRFISIKTSSKALKKVNLSDRG